MNSLALPSQPLPSFLLDEEELELADAQRRGEKAAESSRAIKVEMVVVRSLTDEDIPLLENRGLVDTPPSTIRLRTRHHDLARLVAQGTDIESISLITGYTPQYISRLRNSDIAFRNLIDHYLAIEEIVHVDTMKKLAALGTEAMDILQERMTENSDSFSTRELNEIVNMAIVKPAEALVKATGQVRAAKEGFKAFNVIFRAAGPRQSGPIIEGEVENDRV